MKIPEEIIKILNKLEEAGFEAYVVGGCVRDFILDIEPKDWDITTNAKPEEIQKVFGEENTFYENQFGTVGIKTGSEPEALSVVEATTYRTESKYTDKRHPDEIKFADKLEDDAMELARRLARGPVKAIGKAKSAINRGLDSDLIGTLDHVAMVQTGLSDTEDHAEGVNAFLEKRKPQFKGR